MASEICGIRLLLADVPSAYIMGEFLTQDNAPCHVGDFIKRAADDELDYLCEADLSAAVPPTLDPAICGRIASIAATDRAAAEQHIAFLTGRLFRSSILVRRQSATRLPATPDPEGCVPCTWPARCASTRPRARINSPSSRISRRARSPPGNL